ncbi:LOW QUALITY PROTEIN: hypothetical protein CFOL_v3_29249, partial [Cephalotus follicularis]
LQNHESRPTGSTPLLEVNATSSHLEDEEEGVDGHGRGRGNGRNQNFLGPRHRYHDCRTAKHWVNLYQASLQEKDKQIETNFIGHCDPLETMQSDFVPIGTIHLVIADFVSDPNEKIN